MEPYEIIWPFWLAETTVTPGSALLTEGYATNVMNQRLSFNHWLQVADLVSSYSRCPARDYFDAHQTCTINSHPQTTRTRLPMWLSDKEPTCPRRRVRSNP